MKNDELIKIYSNAINVAREGKQMVGEDNDYYITITQLQHLLRMEMDK